MIKVKLIQAGYGMSILIRAGGDDAINILIDGGTKAAYINGLKKEVESIVDCKERLNLVVCSHIDYDHISGLIRLLDDGYGTYIDELWYNGFLQVIDKKYYSGTESHGTKHDVEVINKILQNSVNLDEEHNVGITEALTLGALSIENKIPVNLAKKGDAVCINDKGSTVRYKIKDTELIVLGPTKECLNRVKEKWAKIMISKGFHFSVADKISNTKAFEMLMERIKMNYSSESVHISAQDDLRRLCNELVDRDESITNESSISFILKHNENAILILGDSVIDKAYLDQMEKVVGGFFKFDAIQLPHHGSRYNISCDFLKRYTAKEYYILTNSERFNHPDMCVLANIAILNEDEKTFVFNYPIEKSKFLCREDWQQKYNYHICSNKEKTSMERIYT